MTTPLLNGMSARFSARQVSAWVVFFTIFLTYASFTQPESPNSTSRLGWVLNLIQNNDPSLAGYADLTIDKSIYDGRYYSDKAPGISLVTIPALKIFTLFQPIMPKDFGSDAWALMRYIATLSTVGLLSAFTARLIFMDSLSRSGQFAASIFSTALFSLGSPIFGWSTLLFGHAAIACLLIITTIVSENFVAKSHYMKAGIASALLLGFAALIEYTSVIPGAILSLQLIGQILRCERNTSYKFKTIAVMIIIGVAMLMPALIYNYVCFGNPFRLGYGYVAGFGEMKSGFFGIGIPNPQIAFELLFGTYRGLIWMCPAIIVMGMAILYGLKHADTRRLALTALFIFLYYLALNSAYAYWNGGFSTGPRHLLPATALPILLIARVWHQFSKPTKILSTILLIQSIIINLAATSVLMMAPYWLENPILGYILPFFFQNQEWRNLALIGLWGTSFISIRYLNHQNRADHLVSH